MAEANTIQLLEDMNRQLRLFAVGAEAAGEVANARKQHGPNAGLPDGIGPFGSILQDASRFGFGPVDDWDNEDVAQALKHWNDYGAKTRTQTRAGILLEEVFEAIAAGNDQELRDELIQVIAMAADWVVDLDDAAR